MAIIKLILAILVFGVFFTLTYFLYKRKSKAKESAYIEENLPNMYSFMDKLNSEEKEDVYQKVKLFIESHTFIGVDTEVTLKDKILIASGLIMMLYRTKVSFLGKLGKIYISKESFQKKVEGIPHNKPSAILSTTQGYDIFINIKDIYHGFENLEDNKNLLLHQYAHILDGNDGEIDGLPNLLIPPNRISEWNILAKQHMEKLELEDTLQNRYVRKNRSEYFATLTEHYFENPKELAQKSPKIYDFLDKIFQGRDFE